ncbi:endolytic transglycosylase MltG [Actinomadura rugatobispora]|uniref:Endolytic murein transglycosylase n=1 Tax=Actinomadura rugatobispora TaxID=1994 RepID=A0ABW1A0N0_9ACTN|nr:endolytic transglycosylase MltG [Actinomadura rugatobispora]
MNDLDLFSDSDPHGDRGYARGPDPRRGRRAGRQRQRRRRRSGSAAFLFAMAFLVAVVGTGGVLGVAWVDQRLHPPDYEGQGSGAVTVQIKDGDSGSTIAATLLSHEVVKSTRAFVSVYGKNPKAAGIQPGFYQMRKRMSSSSAMALLLDPKARAGNQIIIPEGLRAVQVAQQLSKKTGIPVREFQRVITRPTGLGLPPYAKGKIEGYLWPGQYNLNPNASAREILKSMVDRFNQFAQQSDLAGRAQRAKLQPGTVITMASLIQAESGRPDDMPKISRVIYNRLRHKPVPMFLKFDSTTLYGLNKYGIVASNEDIKSKNRYNTYNYGGLPPGAISNPGEKAIDAVIEPEEGDWLFFVATDPKNRITEYAADEQEFNRLRQKLNQYLAQNGGN